MHNQKRLKKLLALCLPLLIVLGVAGAISKGQFLKANDSGPALVDLQVNGEDRSDGTFETEEESVNIVLKAKERSLLELPYDEHVQITPLDESEQEYAYPQIGQADFKKETLLKQFEEANKTEETTNTTETTEEQVPEVRDHDSSLFSVAESDQKGVFYLTMEKDEVRRFKVTRKSTETNEVVIRSAQDNNLMQKLFQFGVTKQELTQAEIPVMDDEMVPEEDVVPEENSEVEQQPVVEEEPVEESVDEVSADAIGRSPRAISTTDPFRVSVDVGRTTGLAPFDTKKEPGYDNSADDDIVRTWDQVSYRVNIGISNIAEKYTSLRIRLDTELPDAWRKDSAGQIRQTAEIANGTMTDTGNGTKKSTRSSWVTLDKATGQAYFTETMETFGGVNGDELNPKFTVTIESATTTSGATETINQVIDGSVVPYMNDTVYVSAKPLVDVKMTWNSGKRALFNKFTNTTDKPSTLVTPVATYVQLKPLPGRSDVTSIKGSTYPVGGIEYKIKQKVTFTKSGTPSKDLDIGVETDPIQVMKYSGLGQENMSDGHLTSEYTQYTNLAPFSLQGTQAPYGYGLGNMNYQSNLRGIYDTGNPIAKNILATNEITVSNTNYKPIENPGDKYLFSGGSPLGTNVKPFSVTAMLIAFPYDYIESRGGQLDYTLSIEEVKYEDQVQKIDVNQLIPVNKTFPGSMQPLNAFVSSNYQGLSSVGKTNNYVSNGDGITAQGNRIWNSLYSTFTDPEAVIGVTYGRWNANSFDYDNSRLTSPRMHSGTRSRAIFYGVGSKVPDDSLRTRDSIDNAYAWYSTVAEAESHGKITAVKSVFDIIAADGYSGGGAWVPLKAVGMKDKDSFGNPNISLTNTFNYKDENMSIPSRYGPATATQKYVPSKYAENGELISTHKPREIIWGDTLYIAGMTIRPTITTDKSAYSPNELINWRIDGKVESGSENKHKVQFDVTIPKETLYAPGSAKDHQGNPLSDPSIIENGDGTWTLTWVLDYMAIGSTYNPKITFDTSIVSSKLNFVNNVANLNAKVVSEVWLEDDDTIRDTSGEKFRTSTTGVTVTNSGVIVVDKTVDKSYIDTGNKTDPAQPSVTHPTDFTYTVAFKNHSAIPMQNVRILDVLPYNGDGRGSAFNGDYSIVDVKQLPGNVTGTIWYTTNAVPADRDPNAVVLSSGWYRASSNPSGLKNAKAIMIVYDELPQGEDMSFTITVRPENQKAGDIYVNAPSLNSHLNQFVQGVPCGVRVVGRDLSGVAWFDDSLDGLIGNKPGQTIAEDFAKDIPVKLYRTSLENPDYKNQLVEESLTGEKFVDSSGNSLIKTDANGKYTFKNLPEGEYVAEFIIDGKIHRVTKQLVGDDVTKNSKADPSNNKTPSYTQPKINELASVWGQDDSINHVTDVNVGLIRPGTIKLFKYEAGTAVDGNNDGQLSDPEKATGKPLQYAVFDLYQGHTGSGTKLGTATTDENGKLQFDVNSGLTENLFPGDYSLVETKAPSGFELLKKPIKVTITEGNQVIQLYQDNGVRTDLPFTGGDNPMLLILLVAASLMTVGFIGLMVYYRQPKRRRHTR